MQAREYLTHSVKQLEKLYPYEEAEQIMYWVYEDVLLLKKKHLHYLDKELGYAEETKLLEILKRLIEGEPIQYVLGYAYFRNNVYKVTRDVLIPRPETEELVELMLKEIPEYFKKESIKILDIGTGSGCIALALKDEIKSVEVCGLDISIEALTIAKLNANQLKLNVNFKHGSVLSDEVKRWIAEQHFDVMVSNPPYIIEQEKQGMHINVLNFEPHIALFVPDEEPLLFYRHIIEIFIQTSAQLLFFEISEFQVDNLTELLTSQSLSQVYFKDLQDKARMVMILKTKSTLY